MKRRSQRPSENPDQPTQSGATLMSKSKKPGKEEKKHSLLTPKEKKAAKQVKKHVGDSVPLLERS
jgi:hypothetical protein